MELRKPIEIQTRDEDGDIRQHHTWEGAFKYAEANLKVWKISWSEFKQEGQRGKRVRLVRDENNHWFYEPMELPERG